MATAKKTFCLSLICCAISATSDFACPLYDSAFTGAAKPSNIASKMGEGDVGFNGFQWFGVFLLDLLLRPLLFFLVSFNIFVVVLTIPLTILHYFLLVNVFWLVAGYVRERAIAITTLVITNVLFVAAFVWWSLWNWRASHATICGSECHVREGQITSAGYTFLAEHAAFQVGINLAVILIVYWVGRRFKSKNT